MPDGMTQKETGELVQREISRHFLSCETGTIIKKHVQTHADKFDSDIYNLKEGQKNSANKLTEASIMLHDVISEFASLLKSHSETKEAHEDRMESHEKRMDRQDTRTWGIVLILISLAIGGMWVGNRMVNSVSKINTVDADNQGSTETLFKVIIEQLSGKSAEDLIAEYKARHKIK